MFRNVFAAAVVIGACFPCVSLSQNVESLVCYWAFEGTSQDTASDVSGGGHDLTLGGTERVKGAIGKGLLFKGGGSKAAAPMAGRLQSPKAVTLEAWARPDQIPVGSEGLGVVNVGNCLIRITRGTPSFHVFTTKWGPVYASGPARPGDWYHLVGTYDGAEMRIYVNGELSGAVEREGDIGATQAPLVVGRQANPFVGVIDEVKAHHRCFTQGDVKAAFSDALKKLNPDVKHGLLSKPFEENFGPNCDEPAPLPTLEHLPKNDLCFAVITDTHIGQKKEDGQYCHTWRVEEALRQISVLKPRFLVNCGDVITAFPHNESFEAQCQNALNVMKKCKIPTHIVPGNHDIGNQPAMRVWDANWAKRAGKPVEAMYFSDIYRNVYMKYFGRDYYRFDQEGVSFFVLNNQAFNSGLALAQQQLRWFEKELADTRPGIKRIVFLHNPLYWNRSDESGPGNYESVMEPDRGRVLNALSAHNVDAVYSGHTHLGFANYHGNTWMRTINSTTFNRTFPGVAGDLPGPARIYDPYQLGFLIVRLRGGTFHESWVHTYWRMPDMPVPLAQVAAGRLVGRSASEKVGDSTLAVRATVPLPFVTPNGGREGIDDHQWRLGEELGSTWMQIWPPPGPREEWEALDRALTVGRPRGVNILMPVPMHPKAMDAVWSRLDRHRTSIAGVILCNGMPMNPASPLESWCPTSSVADWETACERARQKIPQGKKLLLGRLPLLGKGAMERLAEAATAVSGKADGICVWAHLGNAPEAALEPALREAKKIAEMHGLELWLDASGWGNVDERLRNAYFLRLLAVCFSERVRVTWWPGSRDPGAFLDANNDPTPLFHAVQAWHSIVDGPAEPPQMSGERIRMLRWQDAAGRSNIARWRVDDAVGTVTFQERASGSKVLTADPMHARILRLSPDGAVPLCSWPIIERGSEL